MVVGVALAADQPGGIGAVDELDGAVVAEEQVVGDLADGRSAGVIVAMDGEEQLMLVRGQPGRLGLLFAPAQEATEPVSQREQPCVFLLGQSHLDTIPSCDDVLSVSVLRPARPPRGPRVQELT